MIKSMRTQKNQDGITLLITLLLMGVLLGVSSSILNITLKQFQLSGIAYQSEVAFQAANAGLECAQFHDWENNSFDIPSPGGETEQNARPQVGCMDPLVVSNAATTLDEDNDGKMKSKEEQRFQFSWGTPEVCSEFSVYKYYNETGDESMPPGIRSEPCTMGSECTVIKARGYNVACGQIGGGGRVVEREYTIVY